MEQKSVIEHSISWGGLFKILSIIGFGYLIYNTSEVLLSILMALVIAAGFDTPISHFQKKGVPRIITALILFFVGFIFTAGIIYTIVPIALNDFSQIFLNLKKYSGPLFDTIEATKALSNITEGLSNWSDALLSGTIPISSVLGSLFGNIFLVITVVILSFYLSVDQDGIEKFITSILPDHLEDTAITLYDKTRIKIGHWLKGQFLLSLVIGISVFISLWFLDVKYALILGILAGICEVIPYVGPLISGGVAILVALSTSPTLALYTFITFVVIQQLENNLLVPLVMRYTTNLNPTVIMISILIGGQAFGFFGLVLAIPVTVFIQELVDRYNLLKRKRRKSLAQEA